MFCCRARVDRRANSPVSCRRVSSNASVRWSAGPSLVLQLGRQSGQLRLLGHGPLTVLGQLGPGGVEVGGQPPVLVERVGEAGLRRPGCRDVAGADQQAHRHPEGDAGDESHDESGDHDQSSPGPSRPTGPAYRGGVSLQGDAPAGGGPSGGLCQHGAMHRVVIVGAGFGGLSAARALVGAPVEVTIVDQRNFHTFQPLLYEVATAGLEAGDVAYPVRAIFGRSRNVTFRFGDGDRGRLGPPAGHPGGRRPAALRLGHRGQWRHRPVLRYPGGRRVHLPPLHAAATPGSCGTTSCAVSRTPTPTRTRRPAGC